MRPVLGFVLAACVSLLPLALGHGNASAGFECGTFDGKFTCRSSSEGAQFGKNASPGGAPVTNQNNAPEPPAGGWPAAVRGAAALLGTLLTIQSVGQIAAIAVFSGAREPATLEWAGRLDPGNYRIQMLLAYEWRNRGHCDRARPHAEAARRLYPNHRAPRQLLAACRKRRQTTAP